MTPLSLAVKACEAFPLYAPFNPADTLDMVLAEPELLGSFLYILNMVDSRNVTWIDCIIANLGGSV